MAFARAVTKPNTFGMLPRNRARVQARASGTIAAEQGRHQGGPCPAVALATITGWSYAQAEAYLRRVAGFTGAGLSYEAIANAFTRALGTPWYTTPETGLSVAETVRRLVATHGPIDGAVCCRGHVMPVRRGKLLNATAAHASAPATRVWLWRVEEVQA